MFCSSDSFTRRLWGIINSHPLMQPALGLSGQQESAYFAEQHEQQVQILRARCTCTKHEKTEELSANFQQIFLAHCPGLVWEHDSKRIFSNVILENDQGLKLHLVRHLAQCNS